MSAETPIVVVGGGGHARVVIEILLVSGRPVAGFTDAMAAAGSRWLEVSCLGDDSALEEAHRRGSRHAIIALGDNRLRQRLAHQVVEWGYELVNARHPSAIVSPSVSLGVGIALMAGAVLNAGVRIDDLAIVNTGATVDHDCRIGSCVHLAPGSHLAGYVSVGEGALVGVGATVGRGRALSIGAWSVVGAGSVVIEDVEPGSTVVGFPARPLQRSSVGGERTPQ